MFNVQAKGSRRATIKFLRKLRAATLYRRNPVLLNFRDTIKMTAPATVLLTAELDRIKRRLNDQFQAMIQWSSDAIVNQVLLQVGIADICGANNERPRESKFDESVKHWRYATGVRMGDAPGRALERFEGRITEELQSGLWKGLSEALVNSVEHAYLEPRELSDRECDETRWWMFSQERDDELTVVVCDLGIGIPRSLPLRWGMDQLQDILARFGIHKPELAAVRGALILGQTRTGEENRGRGLPQIWQELKELGASGILILSNKAMLLWDGRKQIELPQEFSDSIGGTIIAWTVPIQRDSDDR